MALRIVNDACQILPDRSRGIIVLESDRGPGEFDQAFAELQDASARTAAQGHAALLGIAPAYLNGNVQGPYPVNAEGLGLENVRDKDGQPLPQTHPRMQPARYRIEVPVCRPIR